MRDRIVATASSIRSFMIDSRGLIRGRCCRRCSRGRRGCRDGSWTRILDESVDAEPGARDPCRTVAVGVRPRGHPSRSFLSARRSCRDLTSSRARPVPGHRPGRFSSTISLRTTSAASANMHALEEPPGEARLAHGPRARGAEKSLSWRRAASTSSKRISCCVPLRRSTVKPFVVGGDDLAGRDVPASPELVVTSREGIGHRGDERLPASASMRARGGCCIGGRCGRRSGAVAGGPCARVLESRAAGTARGRRTERKILVVVRSGPGRRWASGRRLRSRSTRRGLGPTSMAVRWRFGDAATSGIDDGLHALVLDALRRPGAMKSSCSWRAPANSSAASFVGGFLAGLQPAAAFRDFDEGRRAGSRGRPRGGSRRGPPCRRSTTCSAAPSRFGLAMFRRPRSRSRLQTPYRRRRAGPRVRRSSRAISSVLRASIRVARSA